MYQRCSIFVSFLLQLIFRMKDMLWEKHLKGFFILVSQGTFVVASDCKL